MKSILKSLTVSIISFTLLSFATQAETIQNYIDKDNHFQINYPEGWTKKVKQMDYDVLFQSKDGNVAYGIIVKPKEKKVTADNYLNAIENEMKSKNLTEDDKKVSEETAKAMGIDDSSIGIYDVKDENGEIMYGYSVYTTAKNVYILVQIAPVTKDIKKDAQTLDDITNSFKVIKDEIK